MTVNPFDSLENFQPKSTLNGHYKYEWVENSYANNEYGNHKKSPGGTKNFLGNAINSKRIKYFKWLCLLLLTIVIIKLVYLQGIKGGRYLSLAEQNRLRIRPISSDRGIFYDRFHRELVQNVPNFILSIVPNDLPRDPERRAEILNRISNLGNIDKQELTELIDKYKLFGYDSLTIKENLDYRAALKLYIDNADLPGALVGSDSKRLYIYATSSPSTAHILGYLGKLNARELGNLRDKGYLASDKIGKVGLENNYESVLRGAYGRKKVEINSSGKEQSVLSIEPPVAGKNLILSIDIEAQNYLEKLIKDASKIINKPKIAAVALNPNSGEILAMVSWPAFNNNEFSGAISATIYNRYLNDPTNPLFNRVIAGLYPPGSTIKPIIAAGALQEGIITPNTIINSAGGIWAGDRFFKDWKAGGHGPTNLYQALAWSVNSFFYFIGGGYQNFVGLGAQKIIKYLSLFNLGQLTGIDVPGEKAGLVPTPEWKKESKNEPWYIGDTYNISIGEGSLLVTPLQVAVWTSAIANGGNIIKPHLVNEINDPQTNKKTLIKTTPTGQNKISTTTIDAVKRGMFDCVRYGSCKLLQSLPFASAAKTGTAQWSKNKNTHAWFTAFAPLTNPQITITILIEEGGEGGVTAIPIAKDFLQWWAKKYYQQNKI